MLYTIKTLLGITDNSKDQLIQLLIDQAESDFVNYTHNDSLCGAENVIAQMVVIKYNLLGTQGISSENYGGISFSYATDYPENILRQMRAFRKLKVL